MTDFIRFEKPESDVPEGSQPLVETATFPAIKKPPEIRREEEPVKEAAVKQPRAKREKRRVKDPEKAEKLDKLARVWSKISPPLALVCALAIAIFAVSFAGKKVMNKYMRPVDASDPTPIVVEIPKGSGASSIAKILYEAGGEGERGLIANKAVFKVYVDFLGKSSGLKAGTYVLSRNMGVDQIVDIICSGNPPRATVKFTMSEGMTVEAIADKLVEQGILPSREHFLELCTDAKVFAERYWFVKNIVDEGREGRLYMLEGYLFPDTYEVYADATEEEIIVKMLDRFNEIYSRRYVERAEEMGLTMDEVVILASMIEKEAKHFDFNKVSAVFHLRLQLDMPLHSDATLGYVLKSNSMEFTQEELEITSPYNTYLYKGLPAGPISNPGVNAIEAALFPNEQYMEEGYLYFCLMDPSTGALIFAKTQEEHAENVAKYRPGW